VPDYRLYWYPGTCARVPFVALEEIGGRFEPILVDRMADDASFLEVNPKGRVPVLTVDGRAITEVPAIVFYLARRHPEAALLPADPALEIDALETLSWLAAGVHSAVARLRFPRYITDRPADHDAIRAVARRQVDGALGIVERRLEGRDWLYGDWSVVDVHLLWVWFRAIGCGIDGSAYPRYTALAARCEERATVAGVLDREEQELSRLEDAGKLPADLPAYQAGRTPHRTSPHPRSRGRSPLRGARDS
jgi:glutathione S-transferase